MMIRTAGFFLAWLVLLPLAGGAVPVAPGASGSKWFDRSHEIFLTEDLTRQASHYRDFPLFWWNFLILESGGDLGPAENLCAGLAAEESGSIRKLPCKFDLKSLRGLTADWLTDLPRRQDAPSAEILEARMNETLAKASMPMDRGLVDLLRGDPLGSLEELKERLQSRMQMNLTLRGGFLVDEKTGRVLIPVQMAFSPAEGSKTAELIGRLETRCAAIPGCKGVGYFGPHFSTWENEFQIHQDVETVSKIGILAMVLLVAFILVSRRHSLLSLVPILAVSVVAAVAATVAVFGSIHGLTIAFGPGLVGLAMDYGIHAAFLNPRSKAMWRSNHIGLITSITIMVILGLSQIPLLRQLMFFAVFGLVFSYGAFYWAMKLRPHWFEVKPYAFQPASWRTVNLFSILFLFGSAAFFLKPIELDVQHLNFESKLTVEYRNWFIKTVGIKSPYILIEEDEAPLEGAAREAAWAKDHGVTYEGIANYLPEAVAQEAHLKTWRERFCGPVVPKTSEASRKFFAPFWQSLACGDLKPLDLSAKVPDYLADFHFDGKFVGLFFTQSEAQTELLKKRFPQATTPREIFMAFPKIFFGELLWMVPLAMALALVFLFFYYRHAGRAALAMVPFLTGIGCFSLVALAFNLPISFISMVGLLMIFGFSLDYGVFVMDFLIFRDEQRSGVWSALSLCCFATLAGFAPLVFAKHPVLNDLGQALLWGSVGTYVGSLWGVPWVYQKVWRA